MSKRLLTHANREEGAAIRCDEGRNRGRTHRSRVAGGCEGLQGVAETAWTLERRCWFDAVVVGKLRLLPLDIRRRRLVALRTYPQLAGRYCSASARWDIPMVSTSARSAMVRETLRMRWNPLADRCICFMAA